MYSSSCGRTLGAPSQVGPPPFAVAGRRMHGKSEALAPTHEPLAAHLSGRSTIGLYPLLPGDVCNLLVCDFDGGSWALDALAYIDAAVTAEAIVVPERSRSGNGAHVWIFFTASVPAATARAIATRSLLKRDWSRRGHKRGGTGQTSGDSMDRRTRFCAGQPRLRNVEDR